LTKEIKKKMKKILPILIISGAINLLASAQSTGDYRSVGSGNWNDPTKWQTYNGNNWVTATTYPGQHPGSGAASIANETEITITSSVPYALSSLNIYVPSGKLTFSAVNAVSLMISGTVAVHGSLIVADLTGTKDHALIIGGDLEAGTWVLGPDPDCFVDPECPECNPCFYISHPIGGFIQTIDNDDKLSVTFNTITQNARIKGSAAIKFQDVTFNGTGILIENSVNIDGTARFIKGVVTNDLYFNDGAIVTGASANSFVDGRVWKKGSGSFTFPIGANGVYSPLTASVPVGRITTLNARYTRSAVWPIISWGITHPNLYSVSDCEYWELNSDSSKYDNDSIDFPVDITLGWGSSSACSSSGYVTNVSTVNMAHLNFNLKSWETYGGSPTGTIQNGTVKWSDVKRLGVFTLGNINNNCLPPGTLTTSNITSSSGSLNWSAVPGAVSYDVDYKRNTTERWTNIATGTNATALTLSGLSALYSYDWRVRTNCSSSSSPYRMTRFDPIYPCGTPSGLTTTNITVSGAKVSWNALTNAYSYSVAYKESNSTSWIEAAINIGTTTYTLSELSSATSYDWRVFPLCGYGTDVDTWGGSPAQASFTTQQAPPPPVCNNSFEANNSYSQAKTINTGIVASETINSAADIDWFKITTSNSNATLQVTLNNLPADYDLYLYNKSMKLLSSSTATGISSESVVYALGARKETFYIKVMAKKGEYNTSGCYHLLASVFTGTASALRITGSDVTESYLSNNVSLFPNPVSQHLYLRFNSMVQGAKTLQISNILGQVVKQHSINLNSGLNQIKITVADIKPGTYLLKVNMDGVNLVRKFVIAR
jgi:hypothetical protein